MDLSRLPVIDNHCHTSTLKKTTLEPLSLAQEFYHGLGDSLDPSGRSAKGLVSAARQADIAQFGVVHTLVAQLAALFDCEPTLDAVTAERNRRTAGGLGAYAEALYQDAGIVGTVVDSDLPPGAPDFDLTPGRILRLFQMGPAIDRALAASESYDALLGAYLDALEHAVRADGFIGVKSHLGEVVGFSAALSMPGEGEGAWPAARAGDGAAYKRLYAAVHHETMLTCQRLNVPVHIHTGITGGPWDGPIGEADPFKLSPLLSRPEYRTSKVVLLHAGYPWVEEASMMAHAYPQVWLDIGWVTPWTSLRAIECMRAYMAVAPLSRLMIGTGGHGTPEVAWLGAKVAKLALSAVLDESVTRGLMPWTSAARVASMILYENAVALYGPVV
jgi:predicted TIM-barrel fold metal-dependent hydrolase